MRSLSVLGFLGVVFVVALVGGAVGSLAASVTGGGLPVATSGAGVGVVVGVAAAVVAAGGVAARTLDSTYW